MFSAPRVQKPTGTPVTSIHFVSGVPGSVALHIPSLYTQAEVPDRIRVRSWPSGIPPSQRCSPRIQYRDAGT
jgi:hypothetical protein